MNESYQEIDVIFNEAQQHSAVAAKIGIDIGKLGDKLMGMVEGYKVTDASYSTARRNQIRDDTMKS